MIQASNEYKQMMKKPIRNRGYVSVALGVINQKAQGDINYVGTVDNEKRYYSNGDVTKTNTNFVTYGTLEDDFTKADGKFLFPPRNTPSAQFLPNGFVSENYANHSDIRITLNGVHDIKGLTIEFEPTAYPESFDISAYNGNTEVYYDTFENNDNYIVEIGVTFGEIDRIELFSDSMVGGTQAWHIKKILMGVGVDFQNDNVESIELEAFISGISAEVSYRDLNISALDANNTFDIDQKESFINYLEPLQPVSVAFGVDLDDGTKEWVNVANMKLKEWSSKRGRVSFTATDLLSQDETNYSHMVLTSRTAKSEFEAIFSDMGLIPSDYHIDDYLASVYITNPIESGLHRDCLQLLANATRSIVYEDANGIIQVKGAFDSTTLPSEAVLNTENAEYVDGDYISNYEADSNGYFADKSANMLNLDDADNEVWFDFIADHGDFSAEYDHANIIYHATAYEETKLSHTDFTYELNQSGDYSPMTEAGSYVITFGAHETTANNYLYFGDVPDIDLWVGSTHISGTMISNNSAVFAVSSQAIADRGNDNITIRIQSDDIRVRGYEGNIKLQITKGTTELPYEPYHYERKNPKATWEWNDAISVSQLSVAFPNEIPTKVRVTAYNGATQTFTHDYVPSAHTLSVLDTLGTVNRITMEILESIVGERIAFSDFSLGNVSPYILRQMDMFELGKAKEPKIKEVKVRIVTYQVDGDDIVKVDDEVYYTETVGVEGITKTCENSLISTSAQAELVAKWLANYYSKGKTYAVDYRGEPTLEANDFVKLENEYDDALVVNVEKNKLTFNGAFHGTVEARQAN